MSSHPHTYTTQNLTVLFMHLQLVSKSDGIATAMTLLLLLLLLLLHTRAILHRTADAVFWHKKGDMV
jgi:hypothetical protein